MNVGICDTDCSGVLPSGEGFGQPWGGCGLKALVGMMNECLGGNKRRVLNVDHTIQRDSLGSVSLDFKKETMVMVCKSGESLSCVR